MNCEEASRLLNEYLDRETGQEVTAEISGHLEKCRDCFDHFEFDRAVKKLVARKLQLDQLSPELKELIRRKIKE